MKNKNGKTKVLGIAAEYNPWHKGHEYQLKESKKISGAEYSVGIMNGNFTQRGEPALLDKWTRAGMAIRGGLDLVLELPFYYGCNSAEYFAKGAVDLMIATGTITHIGFGSESGDIEGMRRTAEFLSEESGEFQACLGEKIKKGISYPKARMEAVNQCLGGDYGDILGMPNNILGTEYLKQLIRRKSSIEPVTVKRAGGGYHDTENREMASASAIRAFLRENPSAREADEVLGKMVPESVCDCLVKNSGRYVFKDNPVFFNMIRHRILTGSESLDEIFSVVEGIERAFVKHVRSCSSESELIEKVKSKRYTYAALSRMAAHMVMDMRKDAVAPKYIRVLGFSEKGREVLRMIKKNIAGDYVLVTNMNRCGADLSMDVRASDVYNIISGENLYEKSDFVMKPVIVK